MPDIDVLLCYRGRFRHQVERLDDLLTERGLSVTFDSEILQPGVEYDKAEIEWLSLGFGKEDGDTSWRGPLSAAVQRSELIVFLVDTQDPSINVINEIAWTARSGKALFVVFDTKGEGQSPDWEAIQVSTIHITYSLATRDPEVPAFGYHFVTHRADDGLDERLTILANRIVSYLEQVRSHGVPTLRMDSGVTLSDVERAPGARARSRLHAVQEQIARALRVEEPPTDGDPLQNALAVAHERERDGRIQNGRIHPKNSPFSYPEGGERERYRRTEELLERIRPGPFENPYYIEMLARELVSVMMVLGEPLRRTVLVGTTFVTPSDAPADVLIEPDYAVLLVDGSLMDFVYQMLKATAMSWRITSPPGVLPVAMSSKVEDTVQVIAASPELVSGFARSLGRLLSEGRPGSSTEGDPPPAYQPAISMLGVFQKRFNVAVALARMVALDLMFEKAAREGTRPPSAPSADWVFAADLLAARWVFDSAVELDESDPTVAFQGICLALASYGLIERAVPGFQPPEINAASARAQYIGDFFEGYLASRQMSADEAKARRASGRGVVAALDLLWQGAVGSGELDVGALPISQRWQRHVSA